MTEVDTVVFGFDRAMTYEGISKAIEAVFDHGARLVALHENNMFRNPEGHLEPGLGAWVRAVEYATGTTALVIGKPSRAYYETALAKLGTSAQDTTMVSDDPVGDLVGAKRMGCTPSSCCPASIRTAVCCRRSRSAISLTRCSKRFITCRSSRL